MTGKYEFGMTKKEWFSLSYLVRKRILRERNLKALEDEKKTKLIEAIYVTPAPPAAKPQGSIFDALYTIPAPTKIIDDEEARRVNLIAEKVNSEIKKRRR